MMSFFQFMANLEQSGSRIPDAQHEGYGYGIRKKEEESIHEFCEAMDMTLEKALFKKSVSH